jgi:hypothetical protein
MKGTSYDRWDTYVLESGTSLVTLLGELSLTRDSSQKLCLILGQGFDPRMLAGLEILSQVFTVAQLAVIILVFDEGSTSPSQKYASLAEANLARLKAIVPEAQIEYRRINMFSSEGRRITSRSAEATFRLPDELEPYSDIFVDVSSLPRSVYFPVVAKLLYLLDGMADKRSPNLFVLVSENADLDKLIVEEGIDEDAGYIHPFRGGMDRESAASIPRVWFPLLGERQHLQLRRIHDLINPAEICPLLPSPSTDPRRSDNLVLEYREMLFDQLRVETRNFLYASETNPFEVCRQLRRAVLHYNDALQPLGGSNAVMSANSSKLLSVGALLAAYELKRRGIDIAIAHVETHGYSLEKPDEFSALAAQSTIYGLWISGECYA